MTSTEEPTDRDLVRHTVDGAVNLAMTIVLISIVTLIVFVLLLRPTTSGEWGDVFGGVVGVGVAAASAILFYSALILQRRSLEVQQRELREALAVATQQAETAARQEGHARTQVEIARQEASRRILGQLFDILSTARPSASTGPQFGADKRRRRIKKIAHFYIETSPFDAVEREHWRDLFGLPPIEEELSPEDIEKLKS